MTASSPKRLARASLEVAFELLMIVEAEVGFRIRVTIAVDENFPLY